MKVVIALPDLISPSYFPSIAAVELGCFESRGIDATIDTIFPVDAAYAALAAGEVTFVAGASHAALRVFPEWEGCRLLCALSSNMYWFLVVGTGAGSRRGDLNSVRGMTIAAAPGPVDGLIRMLRDAGMDPAQDVRIVPPSMSEGSISFGVDAARALQRGEVDAFWANGMGARVAVSEGFGEVLIDARRRGGPPGSEHFTFAALVGSSPIVSRHPDLARSAIEAVSDAQYQLRADPDKARAAAAKHFPDFELEHISSLIAADSSFYSAAISKEQFRALNEFAGSIGLAVGAPSYDAVVASEIWAEIEA